MSPSANTARPEPTPAEGEGPGKTTPPPSPDRRLAIVIPAWRARHLPAALASLRNQTDRRFRLYIGDDASADDLRPLVEREAAGLDWTYHRFEENLGGRDLVAQWNRCLALTRDEPWIWIFSDDDEAEPGCVAAIHRHLDQAGEGATLLRFNTVLIDDRGAVLRKAEPHPERETVRELLLAILGGISRQWFLPDHVFSRQGLERAGGFVNFPRAMCSDHATWLLLAEQAPVRTLVGAQVRFRRHPEGTSSGQLARHGLDVIRALADYGTFALDFAARVAPADRVQVRKLLKSRLRGVAGVIAERRGDDLEAARMCLQVAREKGGWCATPLRIQACRFFVRGTPLNRVRLLWLRCKKS